MSTFKFLLVPVAILGTWAAATVGSLVTLGKLPVGANPSQQMYRSAPVQEEIIVPVPSCPGDPACPPEAPKKEGGRDAATS